MTEESKAKDIFPKLYSNGSTYIDPLNCDSTVGFKIVGYGYNLEGLVDLSDCNRKITWSFNETDGGLEKIDNAINMLTTFRKAYTKAIKEYKTDLAQHKALQAKEKAEKGK